VTSLQIAGETMDQPELLHALQSRGIRRPLSLLKRELIAAKLNLANGGNKAIVSVVEEADVFLSTPPQSRRQAARALRQAMQLRRSLFEYNRRGCPADGDLAGVSMSLDEDFAKALEESTVDVMNMGSLKAMYR